MKFDIMSGSVSPRLPEFSVLYLDFYFNNVCSILNAIQQIAYKPILIIYSARIKITLYLYYSRCVT